MSFVFSEIVNLEPPKTYLVDFYYYISTRSDAGPSGRRITAYFIIADFALLEGPMNWHTPKPPSADALGLSPEIPHQREASQMGQEYVAYGFERV